MFKSPFSFKGRIRRTEYGLSLIAFYFVFAMMGITADSERPDVRIVNIILFFVSWCFLLAQATKRSHDLGNSGLWLLIPFYGLWLLFAAGAPGINGYGVNPKGIEAVETVPDLNRTHN